MRTFVQQDTRVSRLGTMSLILQKGCQKRKEVLSWALANGLVAHDCGYPLSRYTCRS